MSSHATSGGRAVSFVPASAVTGADGKTVLHFGEPAAGLDSSCALVSRVASSRISHTGPDALDLLHRISTNDMNSLVFGRAAMTVLTSERGRVIDVLTVAVVEDGRLLLISESADAAPVMEWIDKFTILEDAEIHDVSQELAQFALIGPSAPAVAAKVCGMPVDAGEVVSVDTPVIGAVLVGSMWSDLSRVDVIVPMDEAGRTWNALKAAGAVPAGEIAFAAARISRGIPISGAELTDEANPLEAGLKPIIDFAKGCYIGQEVVARLDTYDKLQRRLVALDSSELPTAGTELTADGKRAGVVTSVSMIPVDGVYRALGYARRGSWDDGTVLQADGIDVTVRALPAFD
jgi:folate-binding protein YgfZ